LTNFYVTGTVTGPRSHKIWEDRTELGQTGPYQSSFGLQTGLDRSSTRIALQVVYTSHGVLYYKIRGTFGTRGFFSLKCYSMYNLHVNLISKSNSTTRAVVAAAVVAVPAADAAVVVAAAHC
jgi:hypothetical protein